jgi:uncharacterized protein YbaA (DUF1428 family)
MYIDGVVIPVPDDRKEDYRALATKVGALFVEHGAQRVVECWGSDVPHGKTTDFYGAVKAEDGETIVFSWIVWPSREARDAGNATIRTDPRMQPGPDFPFDMRRMIYGGFDVLVDTGE